MKRYIWILFALASASLLACQIESVATKAQSQMLGLKRDQVMACMGPPRATYEEGSTEIWEYYTESAPKTTYYETTESLKDSKDEDDDKDRKSTRTRKEVYTTQLNCKIHVVYVGDRVTRVNYTGNTDRGGFYKDDECSRVVRNCVYEGQ